MKKLFLLLVAVLSMTVCASAQMRTVSGTVIDGESAEPLVGASVVPVGSVGGVTTDVDGNFTIQIDSHVTEITVSYVGFQTQTVPVSNNMTVSLTPSTETLETLVVTGYGSAKKIGSVVGSVSVVGEATLENNPTPTFIDALQGQVAGLSILSNSGDPSSVDNSVRIRGVNSLNGGNTPLYILDGAPITSSVFTTLNPNDIESVAVLKDAASLSIYGSRAANGVIVITSKRGKFSEKPKFTFRASVGWSDMAGNKMPMMDSKQYIEYRDRIGQPVTDEIRSLVDNYGINTNWEKEMFGNSPTYSLEAAVQGGSEFINYYLSFNHMDQEGIIAKSGMRRETIRTSLEARINSWFRVGFQGNLGFTKYDVNNQVNTGGDGVYASSPVVFARKALPYDSPYYYTFDENGRIKYGNRAEYLYYTGLPTPQFYANHWMGGYRTRVTFNGAFFEQINPIKGLTIRAQQSLDALENRNKVLYYPYGELEVPMPDGSTYYYDGGLTSRNSQAFTRYYQFTYTNTAEYRFDLNKLHNFSFLIGQESIITRQAGFSVYTDGQSDLRQMLLQQGTTISMDQVSESISHMASNSYFANASYDFDGRYFLDLSFRRDGSSKFAPGHRWANFFSVGAMWNITGEKFMEGTSSWLNDLRLRASYGTTGNSAGIGNYAYFGLVGSYSTGYNGQPAIGVAQAPNYDLSWETVRSTDVGLTFSVLNNRISGDIDFYRKETVDMLMDIPYSFTTGFSGGAGNIATMTNTGVDLDVKTNIVNTKDWYVGLNVNFNYNKNKITSLFAGRDYYTLNDTGIRYQVGHDAGEYYYVRYAGVDPRDGKQLWYDANGNLTKQYNEDENSVMLNKSHYAPFSGGFGADVRWKWFSLHVDFMWEAKKYLYNNDRYFIENNSFATTWNQMTTMLDVWTTPGQVTDIPKVGEEVQFDTRYLEDASFLRMKNLTFQYTMPAKLVKKAGLQNVAFRFTGRNLLTATKYTGYDPEPGSNIVAFWYPNTRQYEFGVDVTF